ncbi:MAG: hypothetical protein JO297_21175 [Nitrososphaeraceae archaeon]|nr:hypothetical protein [Nitrososphaeraceae archaeon]
MAKGISKRIDFKSVILQHYINVKLTSSSSSTIRILLVVCMAVTALNIGIAAGSSYYGAHYDIGLLKTTLFFLYGVFTILNLSIGKSVLLS